MKATEYNHYLAGDNPETDSYRVCFENEFGRDQLTGYGQWLDLTRMPDGEYRSMVAKYAWLSFCYTLPFKDEQNYSFPKLYNSPIFLNNDYAKGSELYQEFLTDPFWQPYWLTHKSSIKDDVNNRIIEDSPIDKNAIVIVIGKDGYHYQPEKAGTIWWNNVDKYFVLSNSTDKTRIAVKRKKKKII
jgi:hypothetical protein